MSGNIKEYIKYIARGISPSYDNDGIVVLNQKCIRNQKILLEESRIHNIHKKSVSQDKILQNFDVLINSTGVGTLGRVAQVKNTKDKMTVDSHITIVRPDLEKIDGEFFGYCIKVQENFIETLGAGATGQTELSRDSILNHLIIPQCSKENQRKIAKILSNYDDLIENNNKRIKILEEMAQKIYKEWFVDFKFPGHEKATFKETELGKIPSDWNLKTLEDCSNVMVRGITPKYQDGTQKYIINQKVNRGFQLALENLKELSLSLDVPEEKYAKKQDILINSLGEGTIGRIHYFNGKNNYFAVDQHMTICRFKENIAEYLYFYLSSSDGQARLSSLKTGSTNMTMLNISLLRNLKVVLPNKNLLSSYSKYIRIIFGEKNALEEKNRTLKTTRDLLLPRLMSGEIDVENMEIA